jgi:hypothetical protein
MDDIIKKYVGNADTKNLFKTIDYIQREYLDDGFTKDDIPCILSRLVTEISKLKAVTGPQKKKMVMGILCTFVDLDESTREMVPAMIDGLALMLKIKKSVCIRICG